MSAIAKTIIATATIAAAATYVVLDKYAWGNVNPQAMQVQKDFQRLENELIGFTKYTDYVSSGKKSLEGQTKLIAAKITKEYQRIEHIQRNMKIFSTEATVSIRYSVEYSVGFDLSPANFDISAKDYGIEIKVRRPMLVASPSVKVISYDIPSQSLMVDEKQALLSIVKRLPGTEKKNGGKVTSDPAVQALAEKRLIAFVHDFLAKQPGVKMVPYIKVTYL